jgi:VCBS repeat-containing protein
LLSACATSGPSVVGSYRMTFVSSTARETSENSHLPLTLTNDGRFVITLDSSGHAIKGTWSEHNDDLTLKGTDGPAHVVITVRQSGQNLGSATHPGSFKPLGPYALTDVPLPWYGVRK